MIWFGKTFDGKMEFVNKQKKSSRNESRFWRTNQFYNLKS